MLSFHIFFSLQILEAEPLQPETFTVDWNALPELVHPLGGELPLKRLEKKCQQLENLAAAVLSIYQKGDIIGKTICAVFTLGQKSTFYPEFTKNFMFENVNFVKK